MSGNLLCMKHGILWESINYQFQSNIKIKILYKLRHRLIYLCMQLPISIRLFSTLHHLENVSSYARWWYTDHKLQIHFKL
jgi:hypothetical protein